MLTGLVAHILLISFAAVLRPMKSQSDTLMSTFFRIACERRLDQLGHSELRIDSELFPVFARQILVREHLKSLGNEILRAHQMMEQKAVGTSQFIVAAELFEKCRTSASGVTQKRPYRVTSKPAIEK